MDKVQLSSSDDLERFSDRYPKRCTGKILDRISVLGLAPSVKHGYSRFNRKPWRPGVGYFSTQELKQLLDDIEQEDRELVRHLERLAAERQKIETRRTVLEGKREVVAQMTRGAPRPDRVSSRDEVGAVDTEDGLPTMAERAAAIMKALEGGPIRAVNLHDVLHGKMGMNLTNENLRNTLRRMQQRGQVESPRRGVWQLKPPDGAA